MAPIRPPNPLLLALALTCVAGAAQAQTITIDSTPQRSTGEEHTFSAEKRYWISNADCVANDTLTFEDVTITNPSGNLEVWASDTGKTCDDQVSRAGTSAVCSLVYVADAETHQNVVIRAQDIARRAFGENAQNQGTAADCSTAKSIGSAGLGITLHFQLTEGTTAQTLGTFATGLDLVGPAAAEDISSAPQESKVKVSWSIEDQDDWAGYVIYCATKQGALGAGGAGGASPIAPGFRPLALGDAGAAGAAPGTAGATSSGGTSSTGTGGSTAAAGATGTGSTASGTVNSECDYGFLVPGQIPDETYRCGGDSSDELSTKGVATGLTNGTSYQVAVAGVDQFGNVGPLSSVECGTPAEVDTFFERYRAAGGTAGGGFCALAMTRTPGPLLLLSGAALLFAARRRRRPNG